MATRKSKKSGNTRGRKRFNFKLRSKRPTKGKPTAKKSSTKKRLMIRRRPRMSTPELEAMVVNMIMDPRVTWEMFYQPFVDLMSFYIMNGFSENVLNVIQYIRKNRPEFDMELSRRFNFYNNLANNYFAVQLRKDPKDRDVPFDREVLRADQEEKGPEIREVQIREVPFEGAMLFGDIDREVLRAEQEAYETAYLTTFIDKLVKYYEQNIPSDQDKDNIVNLVNTTIVDGNLKEFLRKELYSAGPQVPSVMKSGRSGRVGWNDEIFYPRQIGRVGVGMSAPKMKMKAIMENDIPMSMEYLCLYLEPRHDFTGGDRGNKITKEAVIKATDEWFNRRIGDAKVLNVNGFDISRTTSDEFEKRNFLAMTPLSDNPEHRAAFSYTEAKLTNEKVAGNFYNSISKLIENTLRSMGRSVVRDAKGAVFVKKLFPELKVVDEPLERVIDAAGSSKTDIGGTIEVDYENDIFLFPRYLTPDRPYRNKSNVIDTNIGFGFIYGRNRIAGWAVGSQYPKGTSVYVGGQNGLGILDEISVKKLSDIYENLVSRELESDIALWSVLNLKRAGDQGQALYAAKRNAVFETLDFLAATFASLIQQDYIVDVPSMKTVFTKIKRIITLGDAKKMFMSSLEELRTVFYQASKSITGFGTTASFPSDLDNLQGVQGEIYKPLLIELKEIIGLLRPVLETLIKYTDKLKGLFDNLVKRIGSVMRTISRLSTVKGKMSTAVSSCLSAVLKKLIARNTTIISIFSKLNYAYDATRIFLNKPEYTSIAEVKRFLVGTETIANAVFVAIMQYMGITDTSILTQDIVSTISATSLSSINEFVDIKDEESYDTGLTEIKIFIRNMMSIRT